MMPGVFSILLVLLAIDRDFIHEFGSRGDLIVSCCTDLQTATQVSVVQEGNTPHARIGPAEPTEPTADLYFNRPITFQRAKCLWRPQRLSHEGRDRASPSCSSTSRRKHVQVRVASLSLSCQRGVLEDDLSTFYCCTNLCTTREAIVRSCLLPRLS